MKGGMERWFEILRRMGGITLDAVVEIQKQLAKEWWGKTVERLGDLTEEEFEKLVRASLRIVRAYEREREEALGGE